MNQELRNEIANIQIEKIEKQTNEQIDIADNLAIVLCSYFENHLNRPKDDFDTENGWGKWVEYKTNNALDLIVEVLLKMIRKFENEKI